MQFQNNVIAIVITIVQTWSGEEVGKFKEGVGGCSFFVFVFFPSS